MIEPAIKLWATPAARALAALIIVLIVGFIFNADGAFFRFGTHRDALRQISVYGLLACGMTLVIVSGGIDLAVGSILALTAVFFSLTSIHWEWSPWLAIPVTLSVGAACGFISGALTSWGKFQPFIATLIVMVAARGLSKVVSGGQKVSTAIAGAEGTYRYVDVPPVFKAIDSRLLSENLPVVTLITIVCLVITWILLSKHRWGRELFAIGGNEEAARLSGVAVNRAKLTAYILSGVFAATAGLCQAAQEQQGDPEAGVGYELTAIAIVVIGGTRLTGGSGGVGLTAIGMLTIGYMEKILSINAVPESFRLIMTGLIMALAVLAQRSRR